MVKTAFFAADQDEGAQRGSGRPIPPLVSEIQAATTNAGARPQGGLTPDFLTLSSSSRFFLFWCIFVACLSLLNFRISLLRPGSTWLDGPRSWPIRISRSSPTGSRLIGMDISL